MICKEFLHPSLIKYFQYGYLDSPIWFKKTQSGYLIMTAVKSTKTFSCWIFKQSSVIKAFQCVLWTISANESDAEFKRPFSNCTIKNFIRRVWWYKIDMHIWATESDKKIFYWDSCKLLHSSESDKIIFNLDIPNRIFLIRRLFMSNIFDWIFHQSSLIKHFQYVWWTILSAKSDETSSIWIFKCDFFKNRAFL